MLSPLPQGVNPWFYPTFRGGIHHNLRSALRSALGASPPGHLDHGAVHSLMSVSRLAVRKKAKDARNHRSHQGNDKLLIIGQGSRSNSVIVTMTPGARS
jgi:hypothetical protein